MLGWLYMFNSIRIECSGREMLLIWQEKQSSCNAGMPQWHNLCTIAQIALNHSHRFSQQCGIMGTWTVIVIYAQYRERRSTSLRAASIIALMSCTHETGPLIFFFIDEGGEIRVIVIHAQYREQRSTLSTVHTKYRKCSCVKKLGPKTLTTPLDRLFLEDGTFVEFFSFSAHAEDIDCRGCICL